MQRRPSNAAWLRALRVNSGWELSKLGNLVPPATAKPPRCQLLAGTSPCSSSKMVDWNVQKEFGISVHRRSIERALQRAKEKSP